MKRSLFRSAMHVAAILVLLLALNAPRAEGKIIKTYRLQVASVDDPQAAETLRHRVIPRVPIPVFVDELQGRYKVTAGDFATYHEAVAYKDRLYGEGFPGTFVVEVLSSVSDSSVGPVLYKVQVGNFGSLVNARQLQEELQKRDVKIVSIDRIEGFYKVRVGRYQNRADALKAQEILREAGYPDAWVGESQPSGARLERSIISMAPASLASITPPTQEMRPESLDADRRFQVAVGPYTSRALAEETQKDLSREGFGEIRLTPSAGNYLVEVDAPTSLVQADTLKKTLQDKGFLTIVVSEIAGSAAPKAPEPIMAEAAAPDSAVPAEVAQRLKELQAEVEQLRGESAVESPQRRAEAHLKTAQRLMDLGHWEAARDQYQSALTFDPQNPLAIDGLSASLNAIREKEQTEAGSAMDALVAAAERMLQQGEYHAARVQFKLILERDPTNATALEGLARAEEHLKAPPAGTAAAPSPAAEKPRPEASKQVQDLLQRGNAAIAQGRLAQAKKLLEQAGQLEPDNALVGAGLDQVNRMLAQKQAEQRRQQLAQQQEPQEQEGTSWVGLLIWLVVILVVVGGAAAAVFFFLLRRKKPKAAKTSAEVEAKLKVLGLKPGSKPAAKSAPKKKPASSQPQEASPSPFEDMPESLMSSTKPAPSEVSSVQKVDEPELETPSVEKEPFVSSEPEPTSEPAPASGPLAEVEPAPEEEPELQSAPEATPEPEPEPAKGPFPASPAAAEETPAPPPAKRKPAGALESVFEQSYNQLQVGDEVDSWKGNYETASLTVSQNRLIAGANHYLKFVKEPSAEETLYCMLIPEAGRRPVFEFELCCLGVNEHSIGLYLESVDNEAVSVPIRFHTDAVSQQILLTLDEQTLEYTSGEWRKIRCEIDLEDGHYSVRVDGTEVAAEAALPEPVSNFDMISLKADPETEGTLLLNNLKVSSTREA